MELSPEQIKRLKKLDKFMANLNIATLEEFEAVTEKIDALEAKVESVADATASAISDIKEELKKKLESELVLEIDKEELKGDKGDDGKDYILTPKDKEDIAKLNKKDISKEIDALIKPISAKIEEVVRETEEDLTSIRQQIKNVLKAIPTDYLVKSDIETLTSKLTVLEEKIKSIPKTEVVSRPVFGGRVGLQVLGSTGKVGTKTNEIEFSTGLSVTQTNGRVRITASGGSPTSPSSGDLGQGDFVFATKPNVIVGDGITYRENYGWTWNAGTSTATLSVPPQYDIYAL